jgi:HSP20 family protein
MLPSRRYGQFGLNDFFNDLFDTKPLDKVGGNIPAINVVETDNEYKLELAAPGMTKDDFKVHLNKDGNLVVELEKKNCGCKDKKECKYLRKEFSYARFTQTLLLPDNADKENIQARVENGILFVEVPKLQKPKTEEETKMIEIK